MKIVNQVAHIAMKIMKTAEAAYEEISNIEDKFEYRISFNDDIMTNKKASKNNLI